LTLLNRLLIGGILPKSGKKRGFESMAVLFNNIDYRADKNKHHILNPEKIAIISKYAGIEPKLVFKNLYVQTAYNLEHQVTIAQEIADKIESNSDAYISNNYLKKSLNQTVYFTLTVKSV
jgi:hypothetical protein